MERQRVGNIKWVVVTTIMYLYLHKVQSVFLTDWGLLDSQEGASCMKLDGWLVGWLVG